MNDEYIEYTKIEGTSPEEIVKEHVRIVNEAFGKIESTYSKRWEEMLDKTVSAHWIETIENQHFCCIQWGVHRMKSRAEYLGIEED